MHNNNKSLLFSIVLLTACGGGGSESESKTISNNTIVNGPKVSLSSAQSSVDVLSEFTLSWSSTGADSCTASGDWNGSKSTEGKESFSEASYGEKTYVLTCIGIGGESSASQNVDILSYSLDVYYGTKIPTFVPDSPAEFELFTATVEVLGQAEGLDHQPTAAEGAGKFIFNRVYRSFKHGIENGQQFGIFGSWLMSYGNNSIEGGLWVNPKTAGPQYYPTLHLAGIGDTYHSCNDVAVGSGLYERILGDKWLSMLQLSNRVLTVPGVNIAFDMEQEPFENDNGIWVGYGWSYLNLDHPSGFKFWLSFVESNNYQGPINGYIPEHFNWVDPAKIVDGTYVQNKQEAAGNFGTFATMGSNKDYATGNERINLQAYQLDDETYYVPIDQYPNVKKREYVIAHPQSITQAKMEEYSNALKSGTSNTALISAESLVFNSIYKSTHNQLKLREIVNGAEHLNMIEPAYEVGYEGSLGFVDWSYSTEEEKARLQSENGYIYVRKTGEKWDASDADPNHDHSYKTELVQSPDNMNRAPRVNHTFFNYKERDTSHPDFKNWDVTGKTRYKTVLQNGATVTYVWFKFIDQPAMKSAQQNHPEIYTNDYLVQLQLYIENLHKMTIDHSTESPEGSVFIDHNSDSNPDNEDFHLASIDPAQLVEAHEEKEVGYVPVVISVYHPEEYSSNGSGLVTEPAEDCKNSQWTDTYFPKI